MAFEEAKKYGGKVVLGDRPVQVTLVFIALNLSYRNVMNCIVLNCVPVSI